MAAPEGLEPSTCRLEVGCSIQLIYGAAGMTEFGHIPIVTPDLLGAKPQQIKRS